jgi:hypothetical protein
MTKTPQCGVFFACDLSDLSWVFTKKRSRHYSPANARGSGVMSAKCQIVGISKARNHHTVSPWTSTKKRSRHFRHTVRPWT